MPYPKHANTDCESCHIPGMYEAPDQSKSLPGLLSASSENETWDRKIGGIPATVTGPASRACGGCHRAELINEDEAGGLAVFNQHVKQGGYLIDAGENPSATLLAVINEMMAIFQQREAYEVGFRPPRSSRTRAVLESGMAAKPGPPELTW